MTNIEKLIELVKKYRIIYDLSNEGYKNIRKKDKVWDEIGAELNESSKNLKKKWKNLRDTYARYIRATKTKTGDPAKKLKKWQWADHMEAFRPYLLFAKTCSNVPDISLEDDSTNEIAFENMGREDERVEESNYQNSIENSINATDVRSTYDDSQTVSNTPRSSTFTHERKRRRKTEAKSTSSVESLIKYFDSKKGNKNNDPIDLLFLAHASAVKTFSPKRQAITKMKIAEVIMQQEILNNEENYSDFFRETSDRPSTSSTHSTNSRPPTPIGESTLTYTTLQVPDLQSSHDETLSVNVADYYTTFASLK